MSFVTTNGSVLSQRVQAFYQQLSAAASDLNAVSDELGKSIADLDLALKKLNLGILVWVVLRAGDDPRDDSYWNEQLGYAKIGGKWGVALRTDSGDLHNPDDSNVESWLFNDAPRNLRLSAIDKIPELLEKLSSEAAEATNKIRGKLVAAQEVSEAVKSAAGIKSVPIKSLAVARQTEGRSTLLDVSAIREAVLHAVKAGGSQLLIQALIEGYWSSTGDQLLIDVELSNGMIELCYTKEQEKLSNQAATRIAGRMVKVRLTARAVQK